MISLMMNYLGGKAEMKSKNEEKKSSNPTKPEWWDDFSNLFLAYQAREDERIERMKKRARSRLKRLRESKKKKNGD